MKLGTLLAGGKIIGSDGVKEWFNFPRYRVVAIHYKKQVMFLEVLNPEGEILSIQKMPIDNKQYKKWNTNIMNEFEIIEVVDAFATGKVIECRTKGKNYEWLVTNDPAWNFAAFNYRIKAEPRTFYANEFGDGSIGNPQEEISELEYDAETLNVKIIKLIEVLEL